MGCILSYFIDIQTLVKCYLGNTLYCIYIQYILFVLLLYHYEYSQNVDVDIFIFPKGILLEPTA